MHLLYRSLRVIRLLFLVIQVAGQEITGRENCRHESKFESEVGCVDHSGSTFSVTELEM